jgi:hypothetical protein
MKMMKKVIKQLALETGGSHYPAVGGDLLQRFSENLLTECYKQIQQSPDVSKEQLIDNLKEYFEQ